MFKKTCPWLTFALKSSSQRHKYLCSWFLEHSTHVLSCVFHCFLLFYYLFIKLLWVLCAHAYPENLYNLLFPFRWRGGPVLFKVPSWHHQGAENLQRWQTAKGEKLYKLWSWPVLNKEDRAEIFMNRCMLHNWNIVTHLVEVKAMCHECVVSFPLKEQTLFHRPNRNTLWIHMQLESQQSWFLLTYLSVWCFQALEDAFLAIDSRMTTEEVIKELVQIAGRPTEEPPAEKVAEEDDCEYSQNYLCSNIWYQENKVVVIWWMIMMI